MVAVLVTNHTNYFTPDTLISSIPRLSPSPDTTFFSIMLAKLLWLPLSAVCIYSGSTESKLLRASAKETPNERILENIASVCLTVEQCHDKFLSLDTGGYFYSGSTFPSKGCFMKNKNVMFGTGGTDEEIAEINLPGMLTRVWCDIEVETQTFTAAGFPEPTVSLTNRPTSDPISNQVANDSTKGPTRQPSIYAPTDLGWNHGSTTAMTNSSHIMELNVPQDAVIGDTLFLFLR